MRDDLSTSGIAPAPTQLPEIGPVAPAVARLVECIRRGQRAIALIGDSGVDAGFIIDATMAKLARSGTRFVRVGNPLPTPLSLPRILLQIGHGRAAPTQDDVANALSVLTARLGKEQRIVLVVEQADTLQRQALLFLQLLLDRELSDAPVLQLVFVATDRLWKLLDNPDFHALRGRLATLVVRASTRATRPERAEAVPRRSPPHPKKMPAGRRALMVGFVFAAGIAFAAAMFYRDIVSNVVALWPIPEMQEPGPTPSGAPVEPATTIPATPPVIDAGPASPNATEPMQAIPPVPAVAAPDASSPTQQGAAPDPAAINALVPNAPAPNATESDQNRLRREFDAFLSSSGLTRLNAAQREALFQQYLARHR